MKNPLSLSSLSECTYCATLGQDHVPSTGNPSASVMIIGQSPGAMEVREGKPFVGPSGELVDYMLDEAGLTREEVYIANVVKCRPAGNRPSHPEEKNNCWLNWLKLEIQSVDPQLILLLGKDAQEAVTPASHPFGHLAEISGKKRTYLTSYHPSYFLRKGKIEEFIKVGHKVEDILEEMEEE